MFRPLELALGLRYTRAKRRNHFISFISSISMGGIALAVMLLITVLSVMNGFQSELRNRILGMAAHVEIQAANGSALKDWKDLQKQVDDLLPQIVASAPYIHGQGMLRSGHAISGALIRGVVPARESHVSDVAGHMVAGSFDSLKPGSYDIILGVDLANRLGVVVGDDVDLLIPKASVTPAGIIPRFRRFHVSGVFSVGMYEYDSGMVMISMADAAKLYRMDGVSGLRLKLHDLFKAPQVSHELSKMLPYRYQVTDWTQQNANFFHAVATEKTMMFIILSLIIAVAAFNIVSMLVMVVTDKQGDIAILRTLGMKPRSVMAIFMTQGMLIGVVGTFIGVILGVLLSVNMEDIVPFVEKVLNTDLLSADVYYISQLKGELHQEDILHICGLSLLLSFLSTLYPAWRASRVQPAEALRYE